MRIISDFKDYYDVVQAEGFDPKLVWIRKPKVVEFSKAKYPFPHVDNFWWQRFHKVFVDQFTIGFCGKLYPVFKLSTNDLRFRLPKAERFCHTLPEIDEFVEKYLKEKELTEYYRVKNHGKWNASATIAKKDLKKNIDDCQKDYSKWFIDAHCPVFVGQRDRDDEGKFTLTYNASLRELEFYKVFDPYQAFQEISMYYGGVLGGIREIVPDVPDKVLAEAKGFDKWSFRKEKS
jgi:hypothetical protein